MHGSSWKPVSFDFQSKIHSKQNSFKNLYGLKNLDPYIVFTCKFYFLGQTKNWSVPFTSWMLGSFSCFWRSCCFCTGSMLQQCFGWNLLIVETLITSSIQHFFQKQYSLIFSPCRPFWQNFLSSKYFIGKKNFEKEKKYTISAEWPTIFMYYVLCVSEMFLYYGCLFVCL